MADASSVVRAARELSAEGPVDVLIHNAAHFDLRRKQPLLTSDGIEVTWATNVVGPALLTHLLLPLLVASPDPRVIAVTSKGLAVFPRLAVSLHDPELRGTPFSASRSYYHSKLAHLAWSLALAERLASSRVRVHAVRVGNVKLDLGRYPGLSWGLRAAYSLKSLFSMSPDAMAQTYVWLATSSEAGDCTGAYWDAPLKAAPISTWARSREQRDALWSLIETQTRNITSP